MTEARRERVAELRAKIGQLTLQGMNLVCVELIPGRQFRLWRRTGRIG